MFPAPKKRLTLGVIAMRRLVCDHHEIIHASVGTRCAVCGRRV